MFSFSLILSLPLFSTTATAYVPPHQGDYFDYHEVENLGNGTGSYAGYTEQTVVNGMERMNAVASGVVSTSYSYSWTWSSSTTTTETGTQSGDYTFSSTTFLYISGTDDQTGYVNPTVWFYMNSSILKGGTFYLLNTLMTVISRNYSYYLPSLNKDVRVIFAQGISSYLRNDSYGVFPATYSWNAYFNPTTGYIIGYSYIEHDANSLGTGFGYTDDLYVTSASYLAGTGTASTQYLSYAAGIVILLVILGALAYAISRRRKRPTLPKHSYQQIPPPPGPNPPNIDLTPEQPPVQQIVIKEVVKVNCKYCGTLIDSTATVCPRCGAPRT